jgi:hypothetical protein
VARTEAARLGDDFLACERRTSRRTALLGASPRCAVKEWARSSSVNPSASGMSRHNICARIPSRLDCELAFQAPPVPVNLHRLGCARVGGATQVGRASREFAVDVAWRGVRRRGKKRQPQRGGNTSRPNLVDVIIATTTKAWCRPDSGVATYACARGREFPVARESVRRGQQRSEAACSKLEI